MARLQVERSHLKSAIRRLSRRRHPYERQLHIDPRNQECNRVEAFVDAERALHLRDLTQEAGAGGYSTEKMKYTGQKGHGGLHHLSYASFSSHETDKWWILSAIVSVILVLFIAGFY